jgi:hypothetical protein
MKPSAIKKQLSVSIPAILVLLLILSPIFLKAQQSVSIGDTQVKSNAVLYLKGTGAQGLIIPVVTSNGAFGEQGMLVFNSTDKKLYYHNGTAWVEAGGGATSTEVDGIIGNEVTGVNVARGGLEVTGGGTAASPFTIGLIQGTTDGQVLKWNNTTKKWELGTTTGTDSQDLSLSGTTLSLTNDGTSVTLGGLSILNAVASSQITDATIATADIATGAITTGLISDGTITNADVSTSAAIAVTKLAPGTNGQVLSTTGGIPTWVTGGADSQDLTLSGTTLSLTNDGTSVTLGGLAILGAVGSTQITDASIATADIATGAITTGLISDGTITNADLSGTAAVAVSKLAPGTNGQILSTSAGVPTWINSGGGTDSQDLSLSGTTLSLTNDGTSVTLGGLSILNTVGSTEITDASVANADIATSANIAVTKLAPGTNGQVLSTTGGIPTWVAGGADNQDLTLSGTTLSLTNDGTSVTLGGLAILGAVGSTQITDASIATADIATGAITTGLISDGTITNADVSTTAAIAVTKLAPGTNGQVLSTTGGIPTWVAGGADSQDLTLSGTTLSLTNDGTSVTLGGLAILGAVGSTQITDGSIATADIAAGAITGGTTGVIADNSITNADIATTAAIAVTKIAPGTNGQVLSTTGGVPTWVAGGADSQDLTLSGTTLSLTNDGTSVTLGGLAILGAVGSTQITDGSIATADIAAGAITGGATGVIADNSITNADIATTAAIAVTKIAPGTNGQVLSTTGGVPTWVTGGADSQDLTLSGTTLSLTNDGTSVTLGGLSILNAVGATEITDASIANADIATSANIAVTKLAPGTNGQVLSTTGGIPTWVAGGADSQDLTLSGTTLSLTNDGTSVTLGGLAILGAVGSTQITDGSIATADIAAGAITGGTTGVIADNSITNADIATTAAIAVTKLAPGTNGQVLSTTGGIPTWVAGGADSQDLTLSGTTLSLTNDGTSVTLGGLSILNTVGSTEITDASVANADIATSANIAVTKLAPGTNGQVLSTTGGIPTWVAGGTDAQDLTLSGTTLSLTNDGTSVTLGGLAILGAVGSTQITDGSIATADIAAGAITGGTTGVIADNSITNADIATTAAIAVTKIAPGTNGQVLSTTGGIPTWVAGSTDNQDLSLSGTTLSLTNDGSSVSLGGLSILSTVTSSEITDATIVNADVATAAAIAGTKISPDFGSQNIATTGKTTFNTVAYTWPAAQGAAGNVLSNDGTGILSWTAGGSSLISNAGTKNLFAGVNAGVNNTGSNNAFFGYGAGQANTSAINNSFFGAEAGIANTTGAENTFLGRNAGLINTTGSFNVYVGKDAGVSMASGNLNTYVGYQAGNNANGTSANTFLGRRAGYATSSGGLNTFIGEQSGISNQTGSSNTMVGRNTGITNLTGGTITLLGNGADVSADGFTNATAIGANAVVGNSNTLVLGNNANVGIGISNPGASALYVNVPSGTANTDGLTVVQAYNGASTKTGITNSVTLDGTGTRYGIENSVSGNSGSSSSVYGLSNLVAPNGTGTIYGIYNNISSVGTGTRVGAYNYLAAGATNTSSAYSSYSLVNDAGSGSQYGGYTYLYNTGSGKKYGTFNLVNGTSASAANIYGTYNSFYPYGTGDAFGTFNFLRTNGTGNRYGTYDSVLASSTNAAAIYALYAYTDHAGSGASYGVRIDANKPSTASGSVYGMYNLTDNAGAGTTYGVYIDANKSAGTAAVYGVYVTSDNDGTGNSYLLRGNSIGSTTGTEYGIYISGEDDNYFSGAVGMGRLPTTNKLEVNGEASKSTAGSWIANSDRRIKTDIHTIENATQTLMKLNPVMFHYTADWKKRNPSIKDQYYYNFIAQEFKEVFPEAVQGSGEYLEGDSTEILQIDTYNAEIVTIKAVQELIQRVEKLEKENQQLKAEKSSMENELKAEITEIKKMLGLEANANKKDK